jgi:RNA polymerase sigma factor (sigma-70 family)
MPPGSPDLNLQDLLAHGDWLNRLARQLAGSHAEADDLLQDTWLAALRSPPDPERPARPWLAKVMHNLRRMYWRGAERRRSREGIVAPALGETQAPDTQLLVERVELQRLVARLLLALDEPYRTTILLTFFDGRSSPEISRLTGVPEGTVRWRLKEALARLRVSLDDHHGGSRMRWTVLVAPLGASADILDAGKGVLMMATKSKAWVLAALACVATLTVGGAWLLLLRPKPSAEALHAFDIPEVRTGRLRVFGAPTGRGPEVVGRTLAPDGSPAAAAELTLVRQRRDPRPGEPLERRPRATTLSESDGTFRLQAPGPGAYTVTATAKGFLPASAEVRLGQNSRQEIDLRFQTGGIVVRGRVHDSGGGPIATSEILARTADSGFAITRTNSSGSYELQLRHGRYELTADADGYAPESKNLEALADVQQDFRLNPAARVAGRVLDKATGSPAPGALVRASLDARFVTRETTADDSGAFVFTDLDPGAYLLSAAKGKSAGFMPAPLSVSLAAAVSDATVLIEPAFSISGRVVDAHDDPVSSAQLTMEELRGASYGVVRGNVVALTDQDGRYRINGVLPGRFRIGADALPHAPSEGRDVEVKQADVTNLDLQLPAGTELRGNVITHDGRPVSGADISTVVMETDSFDSAARSWRRGRTDDGGKFIISGIGAGRLTVTAEHPEAGKRVVGPTPIESGTVRHLNIQLAKPVYISGRVRYDDAAPAGGVRVRWDGHGRLSPDRLSVTTASDGSFRIGPASAGRGNLKAEPLSANRSSFGPREGDNETLLTIQEGEDVSNVALILPRYDKSISGVVLGPDGQRVEGANVGAEAERAGKSGRPIWLVHHQSSKFLTDAEGEFTVSGLKRGSYTVWAFHPDFPLVEVAHVDASSTGLRLRFRRGARLTGTVTRPDDTPAPRFDVQVIPAEGPNLGEERHVGGMEEGTRRAVNSPAGAFEVKGLDAGKYDILVTTVDGGVGRLAAVPLREGESREGLRVRLGASLRLKGRIVDLDTGKPLPEIGVGMTRTRSHVEARTDGEGAFAIEHLVPGRTIVLQVRGSREYLSENREITLPQGQSDLTIRPFRLLRLPRQDGGFGNGVVGLRFSNREGPPTISAVLPDSPAAGAQLVPGMVVRSIDGRDVGDFGATSAMMLLRGTPGSIVVLVVETPQGRRSVTLTRKEMKTAS